MASIDQYEEEQIKLIFQFTLENSESPKLFLLPHLSQRLRSQTTSIGNQSNASTCQLCGKLWPNDQLVFHRAICSLLSAEQRAQSSSPIVATPTPSVPRLNRSNLATALKERLSHFNSTSAAVSYLVACQSACTQRLSSNPDLCSFIISIIRTSLKELYHSDPTKTLEIAPDLLRDEGFVQMNFQDCASKFRSNLRGKNILENGHLPPMNNFFLMCNDPLVLKFFSNLLMEEGIKGRHMMAREFENTSALGAYLGVTPISIYDKQPFNYFKTLVHNYPRSSRQDIEFLYKSLRMTIKQSIDCVHTVLKKIFLNKEFKESGLTWIATVLQLNDSRVNLNASDPLNYEMSLMLSTDGFLINVTRVLLEFCKPFLDPNLGKISLINSLYPMLNHRYDFSKQTRLAMTPQEMMKANPVQDFHFVTEIFFSTFYAIHVGIIPSISQYNNFIQLYSQTNSQLTSLKNKFGEAYLQQPNAEKLSQNLIKLHELIDSYTAHLCDPDLLDLLSKFSHFAITWLLSFDLRPGQDQTHKLFYTFPEFFIRDICEIISFAIHSNSEIVITIPGLLPSLMEFSVSFLNSPVLVKSPIIRSKLVTILSELVYKKNDSRGSGIIQIGFSSVLENSQKVQDLIVPGILRIYVDVDIVEGLDVDKEKFDKYNVRRSVAVLLNDLWELPLFQRSMKREASTNVFSHFIGTVVNDSIHLLQDSLARLIEIKQLQVAMSDVNEWNKQDVEVKRERERYYEIQEGSAKGFLTLALSILDLMGKLAKEKEYIPAFMEPHMCTRLAAMLNHFYDSLCGPKCINLKVNNPEKYNFSPKNLLGKITLITSCFVSDERFVKSMANDADYSPNIMKQALYFLSRERIVPEDVYKKFESFVIQVNSTLEESSSSVSSKADEMEIEEIPEAELEKMYVEAMADSIFDSVDMKVGNKFNHHYNENILSSGSATGTKMARLKRECKQLATSLPVSLSSTIFLKTDDERLDVMKAIIVGPKDTPYSIGCFQFDIYFPPDYPNSPCLVNLQTTGNGTVRFNPNLYNCGKVCLSLLGTWHGDNQTSKWNPNTSTVHQVLLSIQALILIEQPYFNEPAYEAQKGTKEGDERSFAYNEGIRLATVRHAILDQLRIPSKGFEEVILNHFRIQKPRLLKQLDQWLKESSEGYRPKMAKAIDDVKKELSKL